MFYPRIIADISRFLLGELRALFPVAEPRPKGISTQRRKGAEGGKIFAKMSYLQALQCGHAVRPRDRGQEVKFRTQYSRRVNSKRQKSTQAAGILRDRNGARKKVTNYRHSHSREPIVDNGQLDGAGDGGRAVHLCFVFNGPFRISKLAEGSSSCSPGGGRRT
jgi:hypothetical protein